MDVTRNHYRGYRNAYFQSLQQQRLTRGLYDTITFHHPSFGYASCPVDKQFFPEDAGGQCTRQRALKLKRVSRAVRGDRRDGEALGACRRISKR